MWMDLMNLMVGKKIKHKTNPYYVVQFTDNFKIGKPVVLGV